MQKVGLIARSDIKGGLGIQTYRLARLLKPDHVMLIDSTTFNGNPQYPEVYDAYDTAVINGFPDSQQVADFCKRVDVVISCEIFYNNYFVEIAQANDTKTILIANYEFLDYHKPDYHHPLPDKLVFPSQWMMDTMNDRAIYLPTPIFKDEFESARKANLRRRGKLRYLFLNGKTAAHDRNGLESLYEALHKSKGDYEVVVKAQGEVKKHPDPRLIYDFSNPESQAELYKGFDMMIMPRRYDGQCLPMTEALQSALPVIMTDISPNNKVLPPAWLVPATKTGEFMTRTMIDIYSADPKELAKILDNPDCGKETKQWALQLGEQYDAETLRPRYEALLSSL